MPKYNLIWKAPDAGFAEAILLATGGEGGAPLQEVLLMADAADGTVYTFKEAEEALEKLTAAGLVQVQKNKLALTPAFMHAYESMDTADKEALFELLQNYVLTEQSIDEAREILKKYKLKNYYQQYLEQYG
ncbi:hypothetical protein ABID22_001390 [Pontibacter aydingkolensis]|uniref:Uncharacterized protein n=1 Tax=Pontibacter aydingkolensis TaxID=1911536 RepID=A0ABS7CNZ1_9BACT|nr:hypothetical protein [Pontibacter aydingkolensis]MBW7465554.1 hypothetical protein [Pontibacter aydingkolensis]